MCRFRKWETHVTSNTLHSRPSSIAKDTSWPTPLVCYILLHRFIPSQLARWLGQDPSHCSQLTQIRCIIMCKCQETETHVTMVTLLQKFHSHRTHVMCINMYRFRKQKLALLSTHSITFGVYDFLIFLYRYKPVWVEVPVACVCRRNIQDSSDNTTYRYNHDNGTNTCTLNERWFDFVFWNNSIPPMLLNLTMLTNNTKPMGCYLLKTYQRNTIFAEETDTTPAECYLVLKK